MFFKNMVMDITLAEKNKMICHLKYISGVGFLMIKSLNGDRKRTMRKLYSLKKSELLLTLRKKQIECLSPKTYD